jgi:hypothetical protein
VVGIEPDLNPEVLTSQERLRLWEERSRTNNARFKRQVLRRSTSCGSFSR